MLAAFRTSFRIPSDSSQFPAAGVRTLSPRVIDLADNPYDTVSRGLGRPSLPQRSSTNSTTASLPCSVTGKDNECTLKSASFSILTYHRDRQTNGPWSTPPRLGSANEAAYVVRYGSSRAITFFVRRWITGGSSGKPYAGWTLPGAAHSYTLQACGRSSIDDSMLNTVSTQLINALDELLPGRNGICNGDESFDGGSDGRQGVIDVVREHRNTRILVLGSDSGI